MKTIVYALLAIIMIATVLGDSQTPLWEGTWKVYYTDTYVYLVILDDLTGYVCPYASGFVPSIAELKEGTVSADGKTYTAKRTGATPKPGEGDTASFQLTKNKDDPKIFEGAVTWPDGLSLPFNGWWVGPVKP